MRFLLLSGSPRKNGNTAYLTEAFAEELCRSGHEVEEIFLYGKTISGCLACRECQKNRSLPGCVIDDDMTEIFDAVLRADFLVLATPIYSWSCTAPMKAALDRLVYGMNKYYGEEKGPSLWEGKRVAVITTCGYRPEKGADLFEESIKRYCKHSRLIYIGMLAERHLGYQTEFRTPDKAERAREFARKIMSAVQPREECSCSSFSSMNHRSEENM